MRRKTLREGKGERPGAVRRRGMDFMQPPPLKHRNPVPIPRDEGLEKGWVPVCGTDVHLRITCYVLIMFHRAGKSIHHAMAGGHSSATGHNRSAPRHSPRGTSQQLQNEISGTATGP
jgi:hypothetical protein